MELNPAPFLLYQEAHENEGFHLKMLLSRKNVLSLMWKPQLFQCGTKSSCAAEYFTALADWMHHLVHISDYYFEVGCRQVKLHLWVSQLHSVYFCIWRKGDGLEGGRFGAKQTARVSTLKVNITLCLNYTPWAQQFSHTLVLSPLSLIPANTPSKRAQLNTLLIPGPAHKSERKSTSDKVSPPRPAPLAGSSDLHVGTALE